MVNTEMNNVIHVGLQAQGREFDILIMEQSPGLRFNRGALLNAAALLLQGSEHDYFVFHDVDTYPTKAGNIQYNFPTGPAPYHITPTGIHPDSKSEVWPLRCRTSGGTSCNSEQRREGICDTCSGLGTICMPIEGDLLSFLQPLYLGLPQNYVDKTLPVGLQRCIQGFY